MRTSVAIRVVLGVCLAASGLAVQAQGPAIRPVTVGSPMPDFTLRAVQFKYFSQNTIDRPGAEHRVKVVEWVNQSAGRAAR